MSDQGVLPDSIYAGAVGDEDFARAYDAVSGGRRAWIKKTAAQAFEVTGAGRERRLRRAVAWTQGFDSVVLGRPLDFVLLVLDDLYTAPARVAAAAVPALICGAAEVATLVLESEPGDIDPSDSSFNADAYGQDVLAALELCGMETVCRVPGAVLDRTMARAVERGARGAVLVLGRGPACERAAAMAFACPGVASWAPWPLPGPEKDFGVWAGDGTSWNFDHLAWAHQGLGAVVWNCPKDIELPCGLDRRQGGLDEFLDAGYRSLAVPSELLSPAEGRAGLVLGPGQDGCWGWPDLDAEFFRSSGLVLSDRV